MAASHETQTDDERDDERKRCRDAGKELDSKNRRRMGERRRQWPEELFTAEAPARAMRRVRPLGLIAR